MAMEDTLMRFDKEGNRRATYLIYTPENARLDANVILVLKDRFDHRRRPNWNLRIRSSREPLKRKIFFSIEFFSTGRKF